MPFALLLLVLFTFLVQGLAPEGTTLDPDVLFHRFLPPHNSMPGHDPFGPVERLLTRIFENRGNLSLVAVPTFLWFSTRLFASMRNSLNFVYDVASRPGVSHGSDPRWARNAFVLVEGFFRRNFRFSQLLFGQRFEGATFRRISMVDQQSR